MRRVRLEAKARAELHAAISWYEEQAPGLGAQLWESIDDVLRLLETTPDGSTTVPGVSPELGVRRVFTRRFPYAIVFLVKGDLVEVIAVAHSSRRPNYWMDRIH
ncbi:MAG TPA: type II toxin-antitoxin system RelE/ParE family toxin [Enhygromyxa sp.]|nr:type II toxin-antitoxin system RelE/ParE family toxin [Enhygromyxa sp.]